MRAAIIRLLAGVYAISIKASSALSGDRDMVLPPDLPATGQSMRIASVAGNTLTWEYYTPASGSGSGTVTSVALTAPTNEFNIGGSPVTSAGTLALSWKNQTANLVFAAPVSGGAGAPTFRALVAADIPDHDASKITTGTLAIARLPVGTVSGTVAAGNDSRFHNQNTDTGTTAQSFQLQSGSAGGRIKNNAGVIEVRNAGDTAYADLVVANLTVQGTQTIVNSEQVEIADNILLLNSNYTGSSPTENGGIEVKRGTLTNASFIWNESSDRWQAGLTGSELDLMRVKEIPFTSGDLTSGVASLTHNLGRKPIMWKVWSNTDTDVTPGAIAASSNQITLDFGAITISGTWTLIVAG
jgi:hypothetical protein